jgi:hypothetical protein
VFVEGLVELQDTRAQRLNVNEGSLLAGDGAIKDEDESELTLRVHTMQVDHHIFKREKLFELEAKHIRVVRSEDVADFDQLHVHNCERVVFHERVEARGVVEWLGLGHSRPASLCFHVR